MPEPQFLVVDCGSKKVDSIQQIVSEFGFRTRKFPLDKIAQLRIVDYAGVIISGSPILLTETDYSQHLRSLDFICSGRIPALGICFGHQLIGLLYGARVFRGPECRGDQTVEIIDRDILFEGLDATLSLREDHCEGITLPPEFVVLAKSRNYEVEAMKHRSKDVYGVQFHPEVSGETGKRIFNNFLNLSREQPPVGPSRED